jgi:broad specificity phosphatase PhoE
MERYPKIYKRWLDDPFSAVIPKGEGLRNFRKRIIRVFKKIVSLNRDKAVAVVCHGGPISIFLNHISKSKDFWNRIPASASVSIIEYRNGKPRIKLFNGQGGLPA